MPFSNLVDKDLLFKILDAIDEGIIFVDEEGRMLYMNKSAEKYRNIKNEERLGTPVVMCHPESIHSKVLEVLENFKKGIVTKRHKIVHANGRYYENIYNVVHDDNGKYIGLVLETRDITEKFMLERELKKMNEELERKVKERTEEIRMAYEQLRRAQEVLMQVEKMTSIGRFVAGLAHEINNPLDGIQNCIRAVLAEPDNKQKLREFLGLALEGLDRIELIVRRLLDYAKPHIFERIDLNINDIIEDALAIAQFRIKDKKIEVEENLSDEELIVVGDFHYLEQVFANIIFNAIDAVNFNGKIEIETFGDDKSVFVKIKDNGCGIPESILNKIFDPFFTTKPNGTGLGLYLSYNVVSSHGGRIEVKSKVGEGSTFTVILPRKILDENKQGENVKYESSYY
ncbi:PAS domain S-box-containing protein [Candidatus Kryptonium thompsonii]|nr:PAS domain S-box-containing protein [Candidatus Kryptonium thompsoni]